MPPGAPVEFPPALEDAAVVLAAAAFPVVIHGPQCRNERHSR